MIIFSYTHKCWSGCFLSDNTVVLQKYFDRSPLWRGNNFGGLVNLIKEWSSLDLASKQLILPFNCYVDYVICIAKNDELWNTKISVKYRYFSNLNPNRKLMVSSLCLSLLHNGLEVMLCNIYISHSHEILILNQLSVSTFDSKCLQQEM